MTTRERWLEGLQTYLMDLPRHAHPGIRAIGTNALARTVTFLPSFPSVNARVPVLGDLVQQHDGRMLGLISPLISENVEVASVMLWLMLRNRFGYVQQSRLRTTNAARTMGYYGYVTPFTRCVPSDETVEALAQTLDAWEQSYGFGDYPAEYVDVQTARVNRQSTRQIKVECNAHLGDPYILRMSQSQIDRGLPWCGLNNCQTRMRVANA